MSGTKYGFTCIKCNKKHLYNIGHGNTMSMFDDLSPFDLSPFEEYVINLQVCPRCKTLSETEIDRVIIAQSTLDPLELVMFEAKLSGDIAKEEYYKKLIAKKNINMKRIEQPKLNVSKETHNKCKCCNLELIDVDWTSLLDLEKLDKEYEFRCPSCGHLGMIFTDAFLWD